MPLGAGHGARYILADVLIRGLSYQMYVDRVEDDFVKGHSWPQHAVSMGGIDAMWNVANLTEMVTHKQIPGDFVETGVWKGANGIIARKLFDAAGEWTRNVWCMDSFEWLPPPSAKFAKDKGDKHHSYAALNPVLRADVNAVANIYRRFGIDVNDASQHVRFIKGYFNETAPMVARQVDQIAILRLDGDMYQSTWEVLVALYEKVSVGGYVIIDDNTLAAGQAAIDFRNCAHIRAPYVYFLPANSIFGPKGKIYWRKDEEITPAVRRQACYSQKRR